MRSGRPYHLRGFLRLVLVSACLSVALNAAVVASAPAPPGALQVGVNLHPLNFPAAPVLDQSVALGVALVRIDIHWSWLAWAGPDPVNWDTARSRDLDGFLDAATQRGIRIVATVLDTPCWASSAPDKECSTVAGRDRALPYPPADAQDFAAFMRDLVRFARGRIQTWEVWNEPNVSHFWNHPDPAAYVRLLQAAYSAIKTVDPNALVLAGALATVDAGEPEYETLRYLRGMYAAGAAPFFDALSYHAYTNGNAPDWFDARRPMHSFAQSVPMIRQVMTQEFGDQRSIWLTESGWTTVDVSHCSPPCDAGTPQTSEARQAAYLIETVRITRGWNYVAALVWYELVDESTADTADWEGHFGLLRRDGPTQFSPKMAATAFASVAHS
ncbi:MAG: GH39 family glycosyl hydrolase [Thermomicrobiales bacterium]